MTESEIQSFWQDHPCGDSQVGGLSTYGNDFDTFFTTYDKFRYSQESHILRRLDRIEFREKQTLEIGLGQGADAEQIIKRGAVWSGVDVTAESVERVRTRLRLRQLPFNELKQGSVLRLPFEDHRFDLVFSHGVLHHVPDIKTAQREILRVLKPDGELIVMLYAKYSLNYLVSIALARRLGLVLLYTLNYNLGGIYAEHLANAKGMGLLRYLQMKNFIHKNTDGPLNPYSKVYSVRTARRDFEGFRIVRAYKQHMHAPPLPVRWLPLQRLVGWHLWLHMKPGSN